nr:transposase domain-containing protein [Pseudomonas gingeri]
MSLIQSARLNGHDQYAYLKDVLTRLPTQQASEIDQLLPQQHFHPRCSIRFYSPSAVTFSCWEGSIQEIVALTSGIVDFITPARFTDQFISGERRSTATRWVILPPRCGLVVTNPCRGLMESLSMSCQ